MHYTRVIRLEGIKLPYWQKITENLWGMSVIERLFDRLVAFDSTTEGAAQLVYKAHLRTMAVEGLREIVAGLAGPEALNGLLAQVEMTRYMQTNEGMTTLLDAKDTFRRLISTRSPVWTMCCCSSVSSFRGRLISRWCAYSGRPLLGLMPRVKAICATIMRA